MATCLIFTYTLYGARVFSKGIKKVLNYPRPVTHPSMFRTHQVPQKYRKQAENAFFAEILESNFDQAVSGASKKFSELQSRITSPNKLTLSTITKILRGGLPPWIEISNSHDFVATSKQQTFCLFVRFLHRLHLECLRNPALLSFRHGRNLTQPLVSCNFSLFVTCKSSAKDVEMIMVCTWFHKLANLYKNT